MNGSAYAARVDAIAEVELERWWRYRCGEPAPGHYLVRCRRDLNHPDGHLGIGSRICSPYGQALRYEATYISWPGIGNAVSAQRGSPVRCWCTLAREDPVPAWKIRVYPRD